MVDNHALLQAGVDGGLLSGPNEPVLIVRGSQAVALAAAAPELLEALIDAIDLIEALHNRYSEYEGDVDKDVAGYHAAIAKATGTNEKGN